jgi:hypothetical protein
LEKYLGSLKYEYWSPFLKKMLADHKEVWTMDDKTLKTVVTDKKIALWCAMCGEKVGNDESTFLKVMIHDWVQKRRDEEKGESLKEMQANIDAQVVDAPVGGLAIDIVPAGRRVDDIDGDDEI